MSTDAEIDGNASQVDAKVQSASPGKWQDPLKKSAAFGQLQQLMQERIIFIDGAMGTSIQKHRWPWHPCSQHVVLSHSDTFMPESP